MNIPSSRNSGYLIDVDRTSSEDLRAKAEAAHTTQGAIVAELVREKIAAVA